MIQQNPSSDHPAVMDHGVPMAPDPIRSRYADDPEMQEIVAYFVAEVPNRLRELRQAWDRGDRSRVRTIAHQMKGAAGGYGFPQIGESAAALETAIVRSESSSDGSRSARGAFDSFVSMLARVAEAG